MLELDRAGGIFGVNAAQAEKAMYDPVGGLIQQLLSGNIFGMV